MDLSSCLRSTLMAALAAGTMASPAFAQDVEGSSDHPIIGRFEGAVISAYQASDFDAVRLPNGPVEDENAPEELLDLEGRIVRIAYRLAGEKTALEVMRSYEEALTASGFALDFACSGRECGRRFSRYVLQGGVFPRGFDRAAFNDRSRALLASGAVGDTAVHVFLYVMEDPSNQRTLIRQVVVESEEMQSGSVTIRDAQALASELEQTGRTVVDGIFFETGSAEIRPESADALEQMALLLIGNEDLNVYIVGHTDNVGSLSYNLELSLRRASAVAQALTERFGIAPERLDAHGVANLSPLANNLSEAGRSLNRRVELVVQ